MSRRSERIGEQIRTDISNLIQREATDPRLSNGSVISITDVDVTNDLRYAKVYVSILGSDEQVKDAFEALQHATGFFRREVARGLGLRHAPELSLRLDPSIQRGTRIMEILRQLEQEAHQQDTDQPA